MQTKVGERLFQDCKGELVWTNETSREAAQEGEISLFGKRHSRGYFVRLFLLFGRSTASLECFLPIAFQVVTNPFTDDGGDMKQYFHPACIFETFLRARPTTKVILDTDDLENFDALKDEDRDTLKKLIAGEQPKELVLWHEL